MPHDSTYEKCSLAWIVSLLQKLHFFWLFFPSLQIFQTTVKSSRDWHLPASGMFSISIRDNMTRKQLSLRRLGPGEIPGPKQKGLGHPLKWIEMLFIEETE